MLEFRIDTDLGGLGERQNLVKGRNLELAVKGRVCGPKLRQALAGLQALDLGERKVLGEPTGQGLAINSLGGLAIGKFRSRGDIGRATDLVLVATDKDPVLGQDQIRLDEVCALFDRAAIGGEGMFRPLAATAAMADDQGVFGRRYRRRSIKGQGHGKHRSAASQEITTGQGHGQGLG